MSRAGIETTFEWFAAPKAVATDLFLIEVDFAAHKPVRPEWIDPQHMAEHFYHSSVAGSAQVNDASRGSALPIKLKVIGEASPWW